MTDCINCNKSHLLKNAPKQNAEEGCLTTVHETVCVQGTVTISPHLVSGTSLSYCVGNPIIGSCPGRLQDTCEFTVSQNICVQIPLTFSATATATKNGVVCGIPETGECADQTLACTHTIGFFRNHSDVTNELIMAADGSITLGTGAGVGLSFIVTTTNANNVLDFDTPSPPAPSDPPNAGKYQNLYAQLLAAKLNVLTLEALDVDICLFATDAITAADDFLATSPSGGKDGASTYQDPLEKFNSGDAPGCPFHCQD